MPLVLLALALFVAVRVVRAGLARRARDRALVAAAREAAPGPVAAPSPRDAAGPAAPVVLPPARPAHAAPPAARAGIPHQRAGAHAQRAGHRAGHHGGRQRTTA